MKEEDKQYLSQVGMYLADLFYNQKNINMKQTANDLWESFIKEQQEEETLDGSISEYEQDIKKMMIKFAKLHVTAALKATSNNVEVTTGGDGSSSFSINGEPLFSVNGSPLFSTTSIINSYPLENIE